MELNLNLIEKAYERIKDYIIKTPLFKSEILSKMFNLNVYLKLEFLQPVGSFKIRGVANKVIDEIEKGNKPKCLVTASSGNHGIALAYFANKLNINSVIFAPKVATSYKIQLMEFYKAKVYRKGNYSDEAMKYAVEYSKKNDALLVHSYDDIKVIEGQATLGLEIVDQIKDIDYLVVPVGGGGLIAGIAYYIKNVNPKITIIGVQSEGAPSLYNSLKKGRVVSLRSAKTIAEGIAVRKFGKIAFEICKKYLDELVLVKEEDILDALRLIFKKERIILEPTGAVSLAVLLKKKFKYASNIVFLLTGRNISDEFLNFLFKH